MIETFDTEWSRMQIDRERRVIRFVEKLAPPTGPLAFSIDPVTGVPLCFEKAVKDADGWIAYESLDTLAVGARCRWRWYRGHPHPTYVGSKLVSISSV